jgi:GNAT superfamily N-acetyltransferase
MTDPDVAGRVLGRAFTTDPVFTWMLAGRPSFEKQLTRVFGAFARTASRTPDGQVVLDPAQRGAAVWLPPDRWRLSVAEILRELPRFVPAYGPRVVRALSVLTRVEKAHPREPHWYLEAIGCVPEARGQGVGGTLLAPVLERCDADGLPAYLESSNPRNIPFYERHGFVARPLFPLPAGCPVITPMWREPR